jgi:hypothetical protein
MKHAHNFKDITGQSYDNLIALRCSGMAETYNKKQNRTMRQALWIFKCVCGKEVEKRRASCEMYKRRGWNLSCGCKSYSNLGNKHGNWKGFGDIPLQYFNNIKKGAYKGGRRSKNIEFNVTIEYLWGLFLKQNRKCAYTGVEICFGTLAQVRNKENREQIASLDRIDSDKGYVEGNVQWVHKKLNLMKQDLKEEDFIGWCKKVAFHAAKKG